MPRNNLVQETDFTTRGKFTKVQAKVSLTVEGQELPNMEVLGRALEKAAQIVQEVITDSYNKVPERADTPMAQPYASEQPTSVLPVVPNQ